MYVSTLHEQHSRRQQTPFQLLEGVKKERSCEEDPDNPTEEQYSYHTRTNDKDTSLLHTDWRIGIEIPRVQAPVKSDMKSMIVAPLTRSLNGGTQLCAMRNANDSRVLQPIASISIFTARYQENRGIIV